MPKVTVDGVELEVPQGATVLQACELAGKEIPRFCYHERLSIAGNCRMCLVEVAPGPPKPQASCALPAADGQAIRTDTRDGQEGARGGDGVPAHQPPARLPDLRPGRRVRPPGPGDGLWPQLLPLRGEQAGDRRQIYGPGHQDLDDPLHPVHALHPLFRRRSPGSTRSACSTAARTARSPPTSSRRSAASLSGNLADVCPVGRVAAEAAELRDPAVGAAPGAWHRRHGRGRLQHPPRRPPAPGDAHPAAHQRGRERGVDQRQDAPPCRRAGPQPARPAVGARERQAARGELDGSAGDFRGAAEEGRAARSRRSPATCSMPRPCTRRRSCSKGRARPCSKGGRPALPMTSAR